MKYIKKLFEILTRHQLKQLAVLQLLLICVSLTEILGIASIVPFMAVVTDPSIIEKNHWLGQAYSFFMFQNTNSFLSALGLLVLLFIALGNILTLFATWYLNFLGAEIGRSMAVNLYDSYLKRPYLFHTMNNSAIMAKNIFQETVRVTNNIIIQFLNLNAKFITVVFIGVGLFLVNPTLTIAAGLFLGVSYASIYILVKKKLYNAGSEMSQLQGRNYKSVNEGLGAIKEVKLHGKEEVYVTEFDQIMKAFSKLNTQTSVIPVVPRYFLEILVFGFVILTIVFLINQGQKLNDFLPALSLFAMAGIKLMPALQQIFNSITVSRSTIFAFDLIFDDLSAPKKYSSTKEKRKNFNLERDIKIEKLSFSYPNASKEAISNLSLNIKANSTVAFVGHSGSGKSTLVDLLLGLLVPTNGKILIDGVELDNTSIQDWQFSVGYVAQHVYLLDASFSENIAFGVKKDQINQEKLQRAISLASLKQLVESKAEGIATRVGERGVQLSGGQRQRIGIARSLYNEASILIFDEATSALDTITENEIMESINSLSGKKTIIMIAHRLSTVKNCDQIFLFENGQVVDQGTYTELLDRNTTFKKMVLS